MIDNYNKLTIGKYYEILDVIRDYEDEYERNTALISVLCDEDPDEVLNLSLSEYRKRVNRLGFLFELPVKAPIKNRYRIGDMELDLCADLSKLTAGQYIDYQTFIKDPDKYMVELLSVFLIPKGKKYGDYDMGEVHAAIRNNLSIADALGMSAFFLNLSQVLIESTLTSLIRRMKRMKRKAKTQEEKMKLEEAIMNLEAGGAGLHLLTELQRQQERTGTE